MTITAGHEEKKPKKALTTETAVNRH